jgi:hypothetical protein
MRALVLSVVLLVSGCSVNSQFVSAVDESWKVIGPRYVEYITADSKLDNESKATRIRTATLLTETIAEAKK